MTTDAATLHVSCPKCDAQYLLPAHLLGPGGARVRCPACRDSFDVPPLPEAEADDAPAAETQAPASVARADAAADAVPATAAVAEAPPAAPARRAIDDPALEHEPEASDAAPASPAQGAREIAHAILDELEAREAGGLERAAREGRLFAQFGPAIFAAWDEYRKRADGGGAASFRDALRERWGVDLPEVTPR
jgi:predicted Zn finger-like uncharacterized protein